MVTDNDRTFHRGEFVPDCFFSRRYTFLATFVIVFIDWTVTYLRTLHGGGRYKIQMRLFDL